MVSFILTMWILWNRSTDRCNTCKHCDFIGSATGIVCPTCDENLSCTWNQTCGHDQICMVRSVSGRDFSTHCIRVRPLPHHPQKNVYTIIIQQQIEHLAFFFFFFSFFACLLCYAADENILLIRKRHDCRWIRLCMAQDLWAGAGATLAVNGTSILL